MRRLTPARAALALVATLGVTAGAQPSNEPFARRQFESGMTFLENHRYSEAMKDLQAVVDSFPGSSFAGTVEQIARAAEFTPRNVQTVGERVKQVFGVKIRLNNTDGRLRAGMAADVIFTKLPK